MIGARRAIGAGRWSLVAVLALAATACGSSGSSGQARPRADAESVAPGDPDVGVTPDTAVGGARQIDAPVAADAPVDVVRARDAGFEVPEGPQAAGAPCQLPDGTMLACQAGYLCCTP